MQFTKKERLLQALNFKGVDRPPVIIPGGMMAGVLYSIIRDEHLPYPGIHTEKDSMVRYARRLQGVCEIDNYGVPFCMTVEAEDFGAPVDLGDPFKEPRVTGYIANRLDGILNINPVACSRHKVTLQAIEELSGGNIPVIGNITGPVSLLTSLIEPTCVYRAMARQEGKIKEALGHIMPHLIDFAREQIQAGADVIMVSDPGASGDIVGGHHGECIVPFIQDIVDSVKRQRIPVILHICGDVMPIIEHLVELSWDALSVDSVVNLRKLQERLPGRGLMGNVSTHLLAISDEDRAYKASKKAIEVSAILAPACGLATSTVPQNLRAMVKAAREAGKRLVYKRTQDV